MEDLIVYALREEYEDFSGGSVSLGDGEEYDVGAALEAGDGRIVLGVAPRTDPDGGVSAAEAVRSFTDSRIAEVLKAYPALEPVDAEAADVPPSYEDVDVSMPAGPTLTELKSRASELDISGRTKMDKDELAAAIAEEEARLAAEPQNAPPDGGGESGDGEGQGSAPEGEASTEGSGE